MTNYVIERLLSFKNGYNVWQVYSYAETLIDAQLSCNYYKTKIDNHTLWHNGPTVTDYRIMEKT